MVSLAHKAVETAGFDRNCLEKAYAQVDLVRRAADTVNFGPKDHNLDRMAQVQQVPKELDS